MELRFKMSLVVHSIIGAGWGLIMIILICWLCDFSWLDTFLTILLTIFIVLVVFIHSPSSFSSSSSAAPPACLDGFIVETNGGTGGAYTCTPLDP